MTTQIDLKALHLALDKEPADWDTRLVLADLYEELGQEDRATFQRWLVTHEKRPCTRSTNKLFSWESSTCPCLSGLSKLFKYLPVVLAYSSVQHYVTRSLAEDALFDTVTRLGYEESERLLME